jgi:aminoglycoside phosphotransferase (APT) family kinase protein
VRTVDVTSEVEQAVAALEPGGRLVGRRELTGGVSANVIGLDIETADGAGRRVVFRQHRADFKQHDHTVTEKEYRVLVALHRHGLAVPEPYLYDDSAAVTAPYLLIEWVDGTTDLAAEDLPAALDEMARFLVGLHALDVEALHVGELAPIEDPRAAVAAYLPPTDTGRRAEAQLAASAVAARNRPVLLHGDYWPGNVMWQGGRLAAVIDWEDACLGDPLADLATARVELLCRHGAAAMDRFTARYLAASDGAGGLQLDALPLWELYVSAAALATMGEWGLEPAAEARRRRRTERFFARAVDRLR